MSSTWIRGPICGTDNCRSRLYRNTDGLKICQFGHVLEGDIEINDEQDGEYIQTKRIKLSAQKPKLQQKAVEKKYGSGGRELYLRCFQIILKSQVEWITSKYKCDDLEDQVKLIWMDFLEKVCIGNNNNDDENNEIGNDIDEMGVMGGMNHLPCLIDSLTIIYIAILQLKLPIYIIDLVENASLNKLPYMKLTYLIPIKYINQLPNYYIKIFEPVRPPIKNDFYINFIKLNNKLKNKVELSQYYYYPLVYKLITKFKLNSSFYALYIEFLRKIEIKFIVNDKCTIKQIPELMIISIFIMVLKIYFTYYNNDDKLDYKKWIRQFNMNKENEENFNLLMVDNNQDNIKKILSWDEEKINNYLNWFNENLIQKQTQTLTIMEKRLFQIFDLEEFTETKTTEKMEAPQEETTRQQQQQQQQTKPQKITFNDMVVIEGFIIDNLIVSSGITTSQLKLCINHIEEIIYKEMNK